MVKLSTNSLIGRGTLYDSQDKLEHPRKIMSNTKLVQIRETSPSPFGMTTTLKHEQSPTDYDRLGSSTMVNQATETPVVYFNSNEIKKKR